MTEELMLGNWVIDTSGKEEVYVKVDHFAEWGIVNYWSEGGYGDAGYMDSTTDEYLKPIPLNKDILIECGAEELKNNEWKFKLNFVALSFFIRFHSGIPYSELGGIYLGNRIKYLHQLQNLYKIICGKQLEIKL